MLISSVQHLLNAPLQTNFNAETRKPLLETSSAGICFRRRLPTPVFCLLRCPCSRPFRHLTCKSSFVPCLRPTRIPRAAAFLASYWGSLPASKDKRAMFSCGQKAHWGVFLFFFGGRDIPISRLAPQHAYEAGYYPLTTTGH